MAANNPQRGFTLIELIVVIILLSILSAVGMSLMPNTQHYNARLAADQWLTFFRLGQRLALVRQDPLQLVQLTINETAAQWQMEIQQGTTVLDSLSMDRSGVVLRMSAADFTTACTQLPPPILPMTLYFNGNGDHVAVSRAITSTNLRVCFAQGAEQYVLCLAPSGYAYRGACVE